MLQMMQLRHTLLPDPVAPATSRCSIFPKSPTTDEPAISFPSPTVRRDLERWNASDSSTSLK